MSGEQQPLTAGTMGRTAGATSRGPAGGMTLRSKDDSSSLVALQALLFVNKYYVGVFWLCQILMFIYKGESLPYASGVFAGEVILVFAVSIVDLVRIALCSFGNLAGNRVSTGLGIVLTLLTILGVIYFLLFQTYTLRAELITCSLALVFHLLGIILAIAALIAMT